MFRTKFGIEIELTGITRERAAEIVAGHLNATTERTFDGYDTYKITAEDNRIWKLMSDASINSQMKENGRTLSTHRSYSVELVSPILTYEQDINILQELVRKLRKAGGFVNNSCGIHYPKLNIIQS